MINDEWQNQNLSNQSDEEIFAQDCGNASRSFFANAALQFIFHPGLQRCGEQRKRQGRHHRKLKADIPGQMWVDKHHQKHA